MGPQGTVVQIGLVWLEAAAEPENGTEKIKFFGFFWVGGNVQNLICHMHIECCVDVGFKSAADVYMHQFYPDDILVLYFSDC